MPTHLPGAYRLQSTIFSAAAALVILLSLASAAALNQGVLFLLMAMIVLLGVPHGALDTLYAYKMFRLRSGAAWLLFGLLYLLAAAAVFALWQVLPTAFLLTFFSISAFHFSGDLEGPVPFWARLIYGGSILVLPCLRHQGEVELLLAALVSPAIAAWFSAGLGELAKPWALASVVAIWLLSRHSKWAAWEFAAVAGLASLAAPLLSFTLYFCGMHSARHMIRSWEYHKAKAGWELGSAAAAPMAIVIAALAAALYWGKGLPLEAKLVQVIFVGLAALTVPHMALVERVRFRAWEA